MGLFDEMRFERACQDVGIEAGDVLQTKSLCALCNHFSITADGKLLEHLYRYERDPNDPKPQSVLGKAIPNGDRIVEYHGDILLYGARRDEKYVVARFTHGRLESLRPLSAYPEEHQNLLFGQESR